MGIFGRISEIIKANGHFDREIPEGCWNDHVQVTKLQEQLVLANWEYSKTLNAHYNLKRSNPQESLLTTSKQKVDTLLVKIEDIKDQLLAAERALKECIDKENAQLMTRQKIEEFRKKLSKEIGSINPNSSFSCPSSPLFDENNIADQMYIDDELKLLESEESDDDLEKLREKLKQQNK